MWSPATASPSDSVTGQQSQFWNANLQAWPISAVCEEKALSDFSRPGAPVSGQLEAEPTRLTQWWLMWESTAL